ncbi:MAG TPA: 50S ribosomal protein L11 methyltransferase [Vicinamibacteria bacterium]|nr:50S ribosomal protein L11 methyltransferase [Vicinamibacteria bacterium]
MSAPANTRPPSRALLDRLAPLREVDGLPGLLAHQALDPIGLWQAWEDEAGSVMPPPFWATVWPAAVVLARCLRGGVVPVAGRRVLEVGCGGAVVAIAAALAGAGSVEANDLDPVGLDIAARNAHANGVSLRSTTTDYSSAARLPGCDLVLAADLFYERTASARLLDRLRSARHAGTEVVLADAGRPFAPAAGVELIRSETLAVDVGLEGVATRTVRVVRLR